MEGNHLTLSTQEIDTIRVAIRVGRVLAVLGVAIAVPLLIQLLTPVVGVLLLALIVLSPLLVTAALVLAARQSARERRQAAA